MSDHKTCIVDSKVSIDQSIAATKRVLKFLSESEVIEKISIDIASTDNLRFKPGKNFLMSSDIAHEIHDSINCNYRDFIQFSRNELEVSLKHAVAYNPSGNWESIRCPKCGEKSPQTKEWSDAVSEWTDGEGEGLLKCPECNSLSPITCWDHFGDMALGHIVFTFWNWPPLSSQFIAEISGILGSPVQIINGKL